jgi:hypothetical protein
MFSLSLSQLILKSWIVRTYVSAFICISEKQKVLAWRNPREWRLIMPSIRCCGTAKDVSFHHYCCYTTDLPIVPAHVCKLPVTHNLVSNLIIVTLPLSPSFLRPGGHLYETRGDDSFWWTCTDSHAHEETKLNLSVLATLNV